MLPSREFGVSISSDLILIQSDSSNNKQTG